MSPSVTFWPSARHDVALGLAVRESVDRAFNEFPVRLAHDEARLEAILHQLGAADMVAVGVADDDVFDVGRIEAELLQAADDRFLRIVVVERVDQDDAFARGQRPGRVDLGADEIEIVEHLGRVGVPGGARRRRRRRDIRAGRGLRQRRIAGERAGEVELGRGLGAGQERIDRVGGLLRRGGADAQSGCNENGCEETHVSPFDFGWRDPRRCHQAWRWA